MLDLNNLYWEDKQNIDNIYKIASELWGDDVEIGEIQVIDSPYNEFELYMKLYGKVNVHLVYDRSILNIGIQRGEEYIYIGTNGFGEVIDDVFDSVKPRYLLKHFTLVDDMAREICGLDKE